MPCAQARFFLRVLQASHLPHLSRFLPTSHTFPTRPAPLKPPRRLDAYHALSRRRVQHARHRRRHAWLPNAREPDARPPAAAGAGAIAATQRLRLRRGAAFCQAVACWAETGRLIGVVPAGAPLAPRWSDPDSGLPACLGTPARHGEACSCGGLWWRRSGGDGGGGGGKSAAAAAAGSPRISAARCAARADAARADAERAAMPAPAARTTPDDGRASAGAVAAGLLEVAVPLPLPLPLLALPLLAGDAMPEV
eukprot:365129-Chlamydomonas_euryale.AAC.3